MKSGRVIAAPTEGDVEDAAYSIGGGLGLSSSPIIAVTTGVGRFEPPTEGVLGDVQTRGVIDSVAGVEGVGIVPSAVTLISLDLMASSIDARTRTGSFSESSHAVSALFQAASCKFSNPTHFDVRSCIDTPTGGFYARDQLEQRDQG